MTGTVNINGVNYQVSIPDLTPADVLPVFRTDTSIVKTDSILLHAAGAEQNSAKKVLLPHLITLVSKALAEDIALAIDANESTRQTNEAERITKENERLSAELVRVSKERDRQAAELVRISNENTRTSDEDTRRFNESMRQANETERLSNEVERQANETERLSNELERQANEEVRLNGTYRQNVGTGMWDRLDQRTGEWEATGNYWLGGLIAYRFYTNPRTGRIHVVKNDLDRVSFSLVGGRLKGTYVGS